MLTRQTILALDIASRTGWACNAGKVSHGTCDLSACMDDFGRMFHLFGGWLADMIAERKPDLILIERAFSRGVGGNDFMLHGLCAHAHSIAFVHGVERREIAPNTIKKFATGNGKAKKADMIAAVRRMGMRPANDHEADSIALLTYWLDEGRQKEAAIMPIGEA